MADKNIIHFTNSESCWEKNGRLSSLIKQAEECTQYLEENSIGYYYWSMLMTLKHLHKKGAKESWSPKEKQGDS